jgi:hypothetical protein
VEGSKAMNGPVQQQHRAYQMKKNTHVHTYEVSVFSACEYECCFQLGDRVARWHNLKPKIAIWVNFGGSCNGRCWCFLGRLVYFTSKWYTYLHIAIWNILWSFGIFFPVLVCRNKKNLATLLRERERERGLEGTAFFSALLKRVERISSGVDGAKLYLRVARFFLVHYTKTGKNIPNEHKMYLMVIKYPKRL